MDLKKIKKGRLIGSFAIVIATAVIGYFFTYDALGIWYESINKPSFNPPNWIFAPVWTILYVMMSIALYMVWKKGLHIREVNNAFWLFIFHLIFNASWSLVFFAMHSPRAGLVNIVLLWLLIVLVVYKFWKVERKAAYLLLPYLAWVSFAAFLNYSIWSLN